nr:hypothetical protein [Tanacetum cinerariifolium]
VPGQFHPPAGEVGDGRHAHHLEELRREFAPRHAGHLRQILEAPVAVGVQVNLVDGLTQLRIEDGD